MSKVVIMTGFHFPPSALSSGHLRLLAFTRYLPEFGWNPVVLSATRCAYEQVDPASVQSIPQGCHVHRAFALDARRHLGIRGRYPSLLAQPDRWASWWPGAVGLGLHLIRRYHAQAIWSTFPIMTAHCIAYALNRFTGLPWVADFRDPVAVAVAKKNAMTVKCQTRWERRVLTRAASSVFTAHGALQSCASRYPDIGRQGRLTVIGNGYDETAFRDLASSPPPLAGRPLMLVHSGLLYPEGRNPAVFFSALARLKASGCISADDLKVVLRASGNEAAYEREIKRLGIEAIVTLAPPVSNREALLEQAAADGLLLFQGEQYDQQIPAKLYEYLRIGRPIFAMVGERGETAAVLREAGGGRMVPLDDATAIAACLSGFIASLRGNNGPRGNPDVIAGYSRREGAALLARLLDRVAAHGV